MKFHWFAEVTYPNLPPDFAETEPTAWVTIPPRLHDPLQMGRTYQMFLRLLEQADAEGFDGLAVNEHHQNAGAVTPSPNLLAAALARTTKQAALLVIGDSLALYNPPIRVAEELAFIDCLSEGRVIAGFVYGTPMDSVHAYGIPPAELRDRFAEAHDLILRAWAADEPFAFNGRFTRLRYVNPWPRPVQKPRPPVWVPGSGSLETWDLVTRENYCYGHLSFSGMDSARPVVDAYWQYVDEHGGDMNPHRMAFTQLVCIADSEAEAEKLYYDAIRYFYTNTNRVSRGFVSAPGYRSVRSYRWELERARANPDRDRAYRGELSFAEYNEKGFVIAGTPATVAERIREVANSLRIGQLIVTLHMGNLSEETARMNTERFAREVAPRLRDVWGECPDHWTPARRPAAAGVPGGAA
jgi:alkanesulfonate monooxygenase SsuD/methylene tetrahydromethanopterin reductase-like flavin-dependent oxidoreductase (luciferase family)